MEGKKTGNNSVKANSKKEKTKLIMGIAMMVFAVAVAGGTYAFYQTTVTGTISGTILAWDCNNGTGTSGNISLGDLKPGTEGSFTLKAYSTNFKTNMAFYLKSGTNVPSNLKFYKTRSGSAGSYTYSDQITLSNTAVWTDNNVAAGSTGKSHTVYWQWPIGTSVETPIASGTANKQLSVPYSITCTQSSTQ